jgi:hypothetical protein
MKEKAYRGQAISLASYTIRVREKRDSIYRNLGAFDGTHSFYDFVERFMHDLEHAHSHNELSMSLQRARNVKSDGESIWGLLEAGDYGYTSELVKVRTLESSYSRTTDDAELIPFYVLLDAPANTDKGILIVQRYGSRGVYTEFTNALRQSFEAKHGEYILDIRRHVPAAIIESLRKGQVKTIQLTSYQLSSDIADKIRWKGNKNNVGSVQITIKAQRNKSLIRPDWLDRMMKTESALNEIPESAADIAQTVRVAVTYNGKQRFVDFEAQDRIAPYLDVSDDVKIGRDGHPMFNSIHEVCTALLFDLAHEIGRPE